MIDAYFEDKIRFQFALTVPSPSGLSLVPITSEQFEKYKSKILTDPTFVAASVLGVTKIQFEEWVNNDFSVICSGKTKKGHRCRRVARDGYHVEVKEYVDRQGYKCEIHEGQA
jgi:hypothetical protein